MESDKHQTPTQHEGRVCYIGDKEGRALSHLSELHPHPSCLPHAGLFVLVSPPASVVSWLQFFRTSEFPLASLCLLPLGLSMVRERHVRSWPQRTDDIHLIPCHSPRGGFPSTHLQIPLVQLCPLKASATQKFVWGVCVRFGRGVREPWNKKTDDNVRRYIATKRALGPLSEALRE